MFSCQISQVTKGANCPIRSSPLLPESYLIGGFPLEIQLGSGVLSAWVLFLSVLLATHIAGLARAISSLSQSTFQVFTHGHDITVFSVILPFPPY